MKTIELPLFEPNNNIISSVETTNSSIAITPKIYPAIDHQPGIYEQVNTYFQDQDSELKSIDSIRDILGEDANTIKDSELFNYSTEVQCLVDQWADDFEVQVFNMPLQDLLGIK